MSPALEIFLASYFSQARKLNDVYDEVTYIIPNKESLNFYSFFMELDSRLEEFDIKSYGVAMPSLEDVFL